MVEHLSNMWAAQDPPQHRTLSFGKHYEADFPRVLFGTSTLRQQFTLYDTGLPAPYLATLMNDLFSAACVFTDMQAPGPLCWQLILNSLYFSSLFFLQKVLACSLFPLAEVNGWVFWIDCS